MPHILVRISTQTYLRCALAHVQTIDDLHRQVHIQGLSLGERERERARARERERDGQVVITT
jgi:hypothetical protein